MAKVRFAAMVGAAALSAGVAVAGPLPAAIAHADGPDSTSAADSGAARGTRSAGHAARGSSAATPGSPVPKPAAGRASDAGTPRGPTVTRDAVEDVPGTGHGTAVNTLPVAAPVPAEPATPAAAPVASPVPVAAATVSAAEPAPAAPGPVALAPRSAQSVATPTPTGAGPVAFVPRTPAPASPSARAVMTVAPALAANASSSASLIDNLLAPIRTLFGEGAALLVRRSFFNEAPSVTPVQLTGQTEGPITGTIGAVDPDGDALTYSVTGSPQHGAAVVNSDGTYTYTPATGFAGNDSFVVAVTDTGFHINLLDLFRPASTSASVAVSQGALAAMLRFQFVYGSGSQYWSSTARGALESAATRLSSYFVVTSPITITYAVTGEYSPFSSTLASAGSDFINDGTGFLQTVVQSKILSGTDANGSTADGTIDWNFGRAWAFDDTVSSGEQDFQSIAMHELLHTLGFLSNIGQAGSNTGRIWTVYDSYVMNGAGTRAINGDYTWNTALNPNLTGGNGGLYFGGPHAVAAYLAKVPLYTPNPWESGSSLSHLNDRVFAGSARKLMTANSSQGSGVRALSPVELGILTDIGYTVNSGPGTPTLLFVGLVTLRLRRRKD